MKAVTWQGKQDMQVKEVPDAVIEERTDVVIEVTERSAIRDYRTFKRIRE